MRSVKHFPFRSVGLIAVVFFVAFVSDASAQKYVFGRADYATGDAPQSIAAGDFNRDGRMDIVVGNTQGNPTPYSVSVLIGNADGTFQPQVEYPVGGFPMGIAVGDFNKDGKLDIAVASFGFAGVSILLGNGDGTFQPYVFYSATGTPWAIATGDFNNDGKLDLAVADEGSSVVEVLLGDGKGGFGAPVSYSTGSSPRSVVVGDFNHDGSLDLATANSFGASVSVLINNGNGTFKTNQDYSTAPGCISVASGDLRHTGKMDLVAGTQELGQVFVLLSNGDGTFQTGVPYTAGEGFAAYVGIGDFNGDGKLDVAVTSDTVGGFVSVLPGNGDGTLQTPSMAFGTGAVPVGIAIADFNTDGKTDLVTVNNTIPGSVSVLLSNGASFFGAVTAYPIGNATTAIINADVNGDGKPDLILADNFADLVSVLTGKGDGTFNPHADYAAGFGPVALAAGDFNKDHHIDLVVANAGGSGTVSVLLNNGDGTFGTPTPFAIASLANGVAVGDFNKDGNLDIVATEFSNQISVLLGNGDGTFQTHVDYTTGLAPTGIAIGDFNRDGWADVAVANEIGTVSIFLNKADHTGTFFTKVDYPAGGSPIAITTASFRGNGVFDLAVATNTFSPGLVVLLGNGDGTFQSPVSYVTLNNAYAVTTGDFNNDGKLDLAVAVTDEGNYPGNVTVMFGQGDGTFPTQATYVSGQTPFGITAADFNKDGGLDWAAALGEPGNGAAVMLNSPVLGALPPGLTFGSVQVGKSSTPKALTVYNPGVTPLRFAGISITGDFTQTNTCPGILASGANCTVNVTFTPTQGGKRSGTLVGKDSAGSSPQTAPLSGTGLAPVASFNPTSLTFGTQLLNTTSPGQPVTLTNTGNQSLNSISISASGDFAQTNNCPSSLAINAFCTITATFTPTQPGTRNGAITVTDNAPNSPQMVPLTGTGTEVQLSPPNLAFGNQPVHTTSPPQMVTLTNVGSSTLNFTGTGITITGADPLDFMQTNTCGGSVPAKGQCTITVTFTPSQTGPRSANVSISDDGGASPQLVPLTGTGT